MTTASSNHSPARIWWTNGILFTTVHIAALVGMYFYPIYAIPRATLALTVALWQFSSLGITVGYHRLYSHRAFRASLGVRILAALLGASAFQGSIKWWVLRHRLHHRFTDDPVHDPYAATRGMLWCHVGWIFYKSRYERLDRIEKADLESDPVVTWQHKNYIPLALLLGLGLPPLLGSLWGDATGAFIWGGLVARLLIWHCTFLVNSLAHWEGLQPYSDENTSKTNLILALFTCGEGNHNFHHAFPHDYRSGPAPFDWDPSKWLILLMHKLGVVYGLRRAREEDVKAAQLYMAHQHVHTHVHSSSSTETDTPASSSEDTEDWDGPVWTWEEVEGYVAKSGGSCALLLDGYLLDVTKYLGEHPGGAAVLRRYSLQSPVIPEAGGKVVTADWAFYGGMNKHTRAAKRRMYQLRIAKIADAK